MELALLVWFAGVVGKLSGLFIFVSVILTIVFVLGFMAWKIDDDNCIIKHGKCILFTITFLTLLSILLPNEKTVYLMAGAYATQKIAENGRVQKIGSDVLGVIEDKLKEFKDGE